MRFFINLFIAILLVLSFVSPGIAEDYESRFLAGGDGYKLDRNDAIVIVYTHGSGGDQELDPCQFTTGRHFLDQYWGSYRMPRVLEELANQNSRIALFYVCHRETGDKDALYRESLKRIPCDDSIGAGTAKFCKRVKKIRAEVGLIQMHNPDLKPSNIFLAGASSGAWTSMLLMSDKPPIANGVIAFAPATNGKLTREVMKSRGKTQRKRRKCGIGSPIGETIPVVPSASRYFRHQCQQQHISKNIPSALVFAFDGDPFNAPLLLPEFQVVPQRIEFHAVPRFPCGLPAIGSSHPHACYQTRFFTNKHLPTIQRYLETRLRGQAM